MKKNTLLLVLLCIGFSSEIFPQLLVDGEFRTRFVSNHGFKLPAKTDKNTLFSVDQRTRLNLNYTTKKYTTRLSIQDARVWGSDDLYKPTGFMGNSKSLGLYEAWVELNLGSNSSIRVGRQPWKYGDMRILSPRNWCASGLSYDAVLYKLHNKENKLFIDIGVSYNNDGGKAGDIDPSAWSGDKIKSMNFVNIKKNINDKLSASLIVSLSAKEDITNTALLGTGTHGLFFNYNNTKKSDGLFADFSSYYQHGTDLKKGIDGNYKAISAYLFATQIGYRALQKKLETSVGLELISGRDYSNSDVDYNNTRHSFDLQYSARFPYYGGNMNHFLIQDSYKVGTKGGGYFNPYLKAKYKLNNKNTISFAAYMPMLTTKVAAHTAIINNNPSGAELDTNGELVYWKGSLGNYFDLRVTHKFSKDVVLKIGMSTASISDIKNQMVYGYKDVPTKQLYDTQQNYFGWVMLIVKPKFFNSHITSSTN